MMAPRDTMIMGDKTPSPGRPSMRKAASHEPLGSPVPLSGGGVCEYFSFESCFSLNSCHVDSFTFAIPRPNVFQHA